MRKILITLCLTAAASLSLVGQSVDPCTQSTKLSNPSRTITSNGMGNLSGSGATQIHYEMWTEGGNNNRMMWFGTNQGGGAAFRAEWNNPNDFLGRVGFYWGNGQQYTSYKNIYCDFNYTRSGNGTGGSYSYIGIYGWGRNSSASQENRKLIEYYIIDDWFGSGQLGTATTGGSKVGEYTLDGGTYFVITNVRTNKPSIDGTKTFTQYFSIRQGMTASNRRQCGSISVTEHFKEWAKLGLQLGNMYECKFLCEAGGGTGWFDASYLKFTQEDTPRPPGGVTPGNYTLTVTSSPTSGGSVTKNPNNTSYAPNTNVQLTPQAATGWKFNGWSGDATGSQSPLTVAMSANKNITAKFTPTADCTTNSVKSGNFPANSIGASADWSLGTGGGSNATASISNGRATINITAAGTNSWEPQLIQKDIILDQGISYRLTFDASAVAARSITAMLQQSETPYDTYASKDFDLTTTTQTFTLEFEMTKATDIKTQLAFNFGGSTQNVTISNVKLGCMVPVTTITLTLNPQSGSVTPTSITVNSGAAIGTLPTPTRTGYTFGGWFSQTGGAGTQYTATSTLTANATAYAKWTIERYTLTLDAQQGSVTPTSVQADYGVAIGTLPVPTRTGYTFGGWFSQTGGAGTQYTATSTLTANATAYAKWEAVTTPVTLTLNPQGGTVTPESITANSGSALGTLPTPIRAGYIFSGWFSQTNGNGTQYTATSILSANATAYAYWTETEPCSPTNLVKDGNFPGTALNTSNWALQAYGGSAATSSVSGGKATINITTAGAQTYQPQLVQKKIALDQGTWYRLTFDASAAAARSIEIMLQHCDNDDYTTYTSDIFNLSATQQTFTLEFEMTKPSDMNTQLAFNVGGTGATQSVTLSNIVLTCMGNPVGIENVVSPVSMLQIYPNPVVDGNFNVVLTDSETAVLTLFNMQGQTVFSAVINNGLTSINAGLKAGVYVVSVQLESGLMTQKLIVK